MQFVLYGPNGQPLSPQTPAVVESTFQSLRTVLKPTEYVFPGGVLGHYKMGLIYSTAAAAANPLLSVRFAPANGSIAMVLHRLRLTHLLLTTAFTTQQYVDLAAIAARGWTAGDTGGSSLIPANTNGQKSATSMAVAQLLSGNSQVLGATSTITAGTRTLDTDPFAQFCADVNSNTVTTGGTPLITSPKDFYVHLPGADHPMKFAQNEGFVIHSPNVIGAAGVVKIGLLIEWVEVFSPNAGVGAGAY